MQIQPLQINKVKDIKTFSLTVFNHTDSLAAGETYLVDKLNKKIWMYKKGHPATDMTRHIERHYLADTKKSFGEKRIGGELFVLMNNQDEKLNFVKILNHSDSAKEISETLYEIRIMQAELQIKVCKNHPNWSTEQAAADYFKYI